MTFKLSEEVSGFFKILPEDWQEALLPFLETYKKTIKCYVFIDGNQIIAGGLVFSTCPPDMLYAVEEANSWFQKGYLYLGFIYVLEEKRGQNLGSLWLNELKKIHPKQNYWLTIEDLNLDAFYVKNGFQPIKSLYNNGVEEKLYVFEASS
ncbi:GNAT family N-acetyltransferase [Mariniflexile litorale]|uniref:GNAT family N-acetyltransferase n=1 Tax=Mariniflexile litorale TaxID=3045158 RepID=A0AAU7EG30_9FLAO|nr:GNAT family N-acetyltransferase [Mariniflexile sp. KMM 9835]MDQ8210048.1 GNAT family N-acetyltransferase [Mariniflexile sp. KMM 9835]